jgi:class 3 adenylate cyclase
MNGLSASELAGLAGVTEAEVGRLVDLGVLVARDGDGPFLETDAQKVRLVTACEQAGIAAAIRDGRLSFGFLEAPPFRRWAVRSARTYRQVSQETGVPLELLGGFLEAIGFARMAPDGLIREDELEVVPLLRLGLSTGFLDQVWSSRLGRGPASDRQRRERCLAGAVHRARAGGRRQPADRQGAGRPAVGRPEHRSPDRPRADGRLPPAAGAGLDRADGGGDRDGAGAGRRVGRPGRVPAMCFLDLVGYTRLTEEQGDQAAAELAGSLAVLVERSSREHGGVPVKWLGDGVMVHFREPAGAVLAALGMAEQFPAAGLPPAHVGIAAGPVVAQGGDYFGRTVNLAARIAAYASASRVLVSEPVVQRAPPQGVTFVELGQVQLQGIAQPVRLLEARRA